MTEDVSFDRSTVGDEGVRPIRVAIVCSRFPVVSQTFILSQVTSLLDLGHDVRIFAEAPGEGPLHPEFSRYEVADRVTYFSIPARRSIRLLSGLRAAVRARGPLPRLARAALFRRNRTGVNLGHVWMAGKLLEAGPFDVIHAHFGPVGLEIARIAEVMEFRAPLVVTFYGRDVTHFPVLNGSECYRILFRRAARVLAVSGKMRGQLISLGAPPSRAFVHHLGVNPEDFCSHERRLASGETFRILTVARLIEKKGVADALVSLAMLAERIPAFEYIVVGDGPLRAELERLAASSGLGTRVRFVGSISQDGVRNEVGRAHVFLLPSVVAPDGDEEGTPTAIIEAISAGLPVVATLHAGNPEVVDDGESGFLVPEHRPDLLAERLELLFRHPETWPSMGRAGRRKVEAEFDVKKLNVRLVEIYREIRAEAGAGPLSRKPRKG